MRHAPTHAEDLLWQHLRGRKLAGLKFRRQHPIGRFIVDFYCVEHGLAIEVDGGVHAPQREADLTRQQYLEDRDITFLRFTNDQVELEVGLVLARIVEATRNPSPPRATGRGAGVRVVVRAQCPAAGAPAPASSGRPDHCHARFVRLQPISTP
jgi:very-short-patch-repair endonuclease